MPEQKKSQPSKNQEREPANSTNSNQNPAKRRPRPASGPASSTPKPLKPSAIDFPVSELEYIIVAEIAVPFGLRGAVKANIQTDFPERFERMEEAYLAAPGLPLNAPREKYKLLSAKLQTDKVVVLRFESITKNEQAAMLRGYTVAVPRTEVVPLPDGEYYIFQIIGLEVYTTEGEYIGKVVNVESRVANDIYLVRGPKSPKDVLLPAIKDIIKRIDLEAGRITIEWMEGLI